MADDSPGAGTRSDRQRAEIQEIYAGAEQAGLRIVGISEVEVVAREGVPGNTYTLTVRVDERGNPIPRRSDTDRAGASLLRLDVFPQLSPDAEGVQRMAFVGMGGGLQTPTE